MMDGHAVLTELIVIQAVVAMLPAMLQLVVIQTQIILNVLPTLVLKPIMIIVLLKNL